MTAFAIHPNVYATGPFGGLVRILEEVWVRQSRPGQGTFFVVSGFGNYNGGVRFFNVFREHVRRGGRIVSVFAGNASQSLTSRQLVEAMLRTGAEVHVVNRKRLLHAKCYGASSDAGESLVVSSGNFTGPGMSLNVEGSVLLEPQVTKSMNFTWDEAVGKLLDQPWDIHRASLDQRKAPVWKLLYDEFARDVVLDESDEATLLVLLGHSDTARIQAAAGTVAGRGTQYFWLSRDCYGFFPPLSLRNKRGWKSSFSCLVRMNYVDLGTTDDKCRVTFEAENNLDFRLGTGPLRHTRLAGEGDIAAITRIGENEYDLRVFRKSTAQHRVLLPHLLNYIGHQGKRYGYLENAEFAKATGVQLKRIHTTARQSG